MLALARAPCSACINCAVRPMAVCSVLQDDEVREIEAIMSSVRIEANETLIEEGAPRRRVYTLTSGMLRLSLALPDGRRQITGFLMPGDYVGLADDETYAQTAEAVVPAYLCSFPAADMDRLAERFPRLKDRLHVLTKSALRHARETQMILGRLTPAEKVASFLLFMSKRAAEHGMPESPIHLPMNRTDIADYLGLTVETVSRTFTKLKTQGLIHLPGPHSAGIADRAGLVAIAGVGVG